MTRHTFPAPDPHGTHTIVYHEYGPADGRPVLCVHYLTGNGTYFRALAEALAANGLRVIAVDMPGRGESDDLADAEDYNFQQYIADLNALIGRLNLRPGEKIDWIGASMGGLLGLVMAAVKDGPVGRLALVDIGPFVSVDVLQQIAASVGVGKVFATLDEATAYFEKFRAESWGPVPEGYWQAFARDNTRPGPEGGFVLAYDPKISRPFRSESDTDIDLWTLWDSVPCPVLVLRGEHSPVLPESVAAEMMTRGPGKAGQVQLNVIANCGHVPSLAMAGQIEIVREWLAP